MQTIEYSGGSLRYMVTTPHGFNPPTSYPLIVLLHGGGDMNQLTHLAPEINKTSYIYAFPQAPLQVPGGIPLAGTELDSTEGYSWHPYTPRGHRGPPPDDVVKGRLKALELLDGFLFEVMHRYRVPEARMLLGGFAMGGSMTYRYGLAKPENFVGLALLSAGEANPVELRPRLPSRRGQSIFIAHGTSDPLLNVEWSRKAVQFLDSEGYHTDYREYDAGHEISADAVIDLSRWVAEVLPPS